MLAAGLFGGLLILCGSGVGLVPVSVSAQPPAVPTFPPLASPIRTFIPFDEPDADFYSFEVSDLEVYNLEFDMSGATVGIGSGNGTNDTNDVLEIQGLSSGSFGIAKPKTIGFGDRVSVQGTVGVPMDGNTPRLDGIEPGKSFGGFQINDKQSDPPRFVIGATFPGADGTTVVGATQEGTLGQMFLPGVFAVELVVDRGVDDIDGVPHDGAGVRYRPAGSQDDFAILFDRYFQITDEGSDPVVPNENGFQTTWADRLGPGATMFIDDVFTVDLRDPAVVPVTTLIDEAFDLEIEAFVLIAQDPGGAK